MPQKNITKQIKVVTDQHIVKGQKQNGFPMRKWKISLQAANTAGGVDTLQYIDHVEYILHHTFEQPLRKVTNYPFMLQEKGWGEFDMKIMLYFADKSTAPFVLDHDLNFQLGHYEVAHTLSFKPDVKSSFMKLLNPSAESVSDRDSQISSSESVVGGKAQKRRRDDALKKNVKRIKEDRTSDEDESSAAVSEDEWSEKVDVQLLAEKFQQLQAEDLAELVQLVKDHQTADMYVKEDGEAGEFHIDLRTLGEELLSILWQFCTNRLE